MDTFETEKLVGIRTLSGIEKLRFIYDDESFYCNDSVVVLTLWHLFEKENNQTIKRNINTKRIANSKNFEYRYVQAILNSVLIKFYFNELMYDSTHFYPNQMKVLPIKLADKSIQHKLSSIAFYLYHLEFGTYSLEYNFYSQLSDAITFELYFPNEIKQANKEIIKHLGNLKAIDKSMSDEKKLAIIQGEFNRLYDPNHPVRNNLETLDNIEEIRIIKEAVK